LLSVKPNRPRPSITAATRKSAPGTGFVGSMTPGVFALDTSIVPGAAAYPIKDTARPLVDRFRASSDLDEKLVTSPPRDGAGLLERPARERAGNQPTLPAGDGHFARTR
jgi:hypothetical protein